MVDLSRDVVWQMKCDGGRRVKANVFGVQVEAKLLARLHLPRAEVTVLITRCFDHSSFLTAGARWCGDAG